jgi:hypothetical protein
MDICVIASESVCGYVNESAINSQYVSVLDLETVNETNCCKENNITNESNENTIINTTIQTPTTKIVLKMNGDCKFLKYLKLSGSKITKCTINGKPTEYLTYKRTLLTLYKAIGDGAKIIKNSIFDIKTTKFTEESFSFVKGLNISVKFKNNKKSYMTEIINQAKANNITVSVEIELKDGTMLSVNVTSSN